MMRVDGVSMKDAGILDGDLLVVDRADPKYQPLCVSIGEELHVFGAVKHAIHTLR